MEGCLTEDRDEGSAMATDVAVYFPPASAQTKEDVVWVDTRNCVN
jgi:hypothetical protein